MKINIPNISTWGGSIYDNDTRGRKWRAKSFSDKHAMKRYNQDGPILVRLWYIVACLLGFYRTLKDT